MVFSSPIFLFLFLPITLLLVFLTERYKWRNIPLLILSIFFYVFGEGELILLMFSSITFNYFIGIKIGKNKGKWPITIGIFINILLLGIFKYSSFVIENVNHLLAVFNVHQIENVHIRLPIGISFYTFQAVSYLIDVYRKENDAQKSYVDLALYICLFPQLIAGPIVRYKDVALQLRTRFTNSHKFYLGIERFIIGLGKKVILANSLGSCADMVFDVNANTLSSSAAWFGICCYSMQLYFDFSGYSDMAIGLGKMMGFDFLENFHFPYKAKSIREFWQRWHISLSNWFRDYLYIPLGGNRVSPKRVYLNLFIVFFLTGLWHGASWNFVVWGLLHGLFMILERVGFGKVLARLPGIIQHFYTLFLVVLFWVFFRAVDIAASKHFLSTLAGIGNTSDYSFSMITNLEINIAFILGVILSFNGFNIAIKKLMVRVLANSDDTKMVKAVFKNVKVIFLLIVFLYCILKIAAGSYNPFIYFRF